MLEGQGFLIHLISLLYKNVPSLHKQITYMKTLVVGPINALGQAQNFLNITF